MDFIKSWRGIVSALTAIVLIASATLALTNHFATASGVEAVATKIMAEVRLVSLRLDNKIKGDKKDRLQARIWAYEDRFGCIGLAACKMYMPEEVFIIYRQMTSDINKMK